MQINLLNVEDLIFLDKSVQSVLPEHRALFDQWTLSKRVPGMKSLGRRTVLDLLNSLTAENIQALENHFGEAVILDKMDYRLVRNFEATTEELEAGLCQFVGFQDFCLTRDGTQTYISMWR